MKIALIEASHWHAPLYIEALAQAGAEVVGVSDTIPAVAERVATRLHSTAFPEHRAMLDATRPDFVFAFGRHVAMPDIARDLVARGIAFAMEKPMGRSAAEVEPLCRIVEQTAAFVAVPFVFRYSPIRELLDRLSSEGEFGELTNGYARFIAGPPGRYPKADCGWLLDPSQSGGGCTINLGVHFVDLFVTLLRGRGFDRVYAVPSSRKYGLAVEDFSTAVLSTADDVVCTVETGYSYPSDRDHPRHFSCCLTTTKGYLAIDEGRFAWAGHDGRRIEEAIVTDTDRFYPVFVRQVLDDAQAGRPPAATVSDMHRVMTLIDAIYASGRARQAVRP
jgi:predicted dehydrogenase